MFGVFDFGFPYFADIFQEAAPPPAGDFGPTTAGLGQPKSFSDANELGGGGW